MDKLNILDNPQVKTLLNWLEIPNVENPLDENTHCASRDIFQAKLDTFYKDKMDFSKSDNLANGCLAVLKIY